MDAVFFDVDFTLIYPGPTFRGEGYQRFCARHGITVDPEKFADAVASSAPLLDGPEDTLYDDEVFVAYTRHIIQRMGGSGDAVDACAREINAEWAACRHFELYDEVPFVLRELAARGIRLGLISNTHRCLASFQAHFELQGLITAAVSSSAHGFMKPHPSIFSAALQLAGVRAGDALMVGDSIRSDVEGALGVGMAAVFLDRGTLPHPQAARLSALNVPVIRSLTELLELPYVKG